jgi:hypothetical protein
MDFLSGALQISFTTLLSLKTISVDIEDWQVVGLQMEYSIKPFKSNLINSLTRPKWRWNYFLGSHPWNANPSRKARNLAILAMEVNKWSRTVARFIFTCRSISSGKPSGSSVGFLSNSCTHVRI